MRVSIGTHHSQCLVFAFFLILDSIIDLWLYISLMITNAEYFFMGFFGAQISYLVKYLFRSFAHVFTGLSSYFLVYDSFLFIYILEYIYINIYINVRNNSFVRYVFLLLFQLFNGVFIIIFVKKNM